MSHSVPDDERDPPSARSNNNPAPRSSQNKPQLLDAMMRNVPKLKELNYTHWNNMITNSIKKSKLWGYVDGTIQEPSDHDAGNLATYYDEIAAVRNAILGSLEPGAQRYIEDTLDARDAWLALEKKYLTAEAETDAELLATEKQLGDMRLEEEGDMVEHIAEFCRMRCRLNGTRFALDDQACISMLYRSLPSSYRQSALTPEKAEMKDFGALCARLSDLSQNPQPQTIPDDAPEDYTNWGVPKDVKAFELTGSKNPLLSERATVTCRDCLLKDHKAGTPDCPQYEWRKELWGDLDKTGDEEASQSATNSQVVKSAKRLTYEFSEPVKVVLGFGEMELNKVLLSRLAQLNMFTPYGLQQCAVLPMISGRNVLAQAPKDCGKTVTLVISILQSMNQGFLGVQAIVLTADTKAAANFSNFLLRLAKRDEFSSSQWVQFYVCGDDNESIQADLSWFATKSRDHVVLGTPSRILELIRRKILQTHHLKILALDDVERVIEAGFASQLLDLRRNLPSSPQTIATFTALHPELIQTTNDIMTNPLHITVNDNHMIFRGRHFFVVVPLATKCNLNLIRGIREFLDSKRAVLFVRDSGTEFTHILRNIGDGYNYGMTESTSASQCEQNIQSFVSNGPGYLSSLVTSDLAPLTWVKIYDRPNVPLIQCHAPRDHQEYVKRLNHYGASMKHNAVVTLITAETDEINKIHEIEQLYGINIVELHWDGKNIS